MGFENDPVGLTNSVPTLPVIDSSKLEWTVDVRVRMSKVDVLLIWNEIMVGSIGFGSI
jgi:uncharacterized protein with ACT and thioredoxin-like domain